MYTPHLALSTTSPDSSIFLDETLYTTLISDEMQQAGVITSDSIYKSENTLNRVTIYFRTNLCNICDGKY